MLYELKNVVRQFRGKTVLDIPSLGFESGKIYSLIGPNGAGKTTLLKLLAFLDKPTTGEVLFKEEQVGYGPKQLLGYRRRVTLVEQYPILFTGPVWANVEYGLKVRNVPAAERKKRVSRMLKLVGMEKFVEAEAHKLSGGETKRVALARGLAVGPEVLLCDEPGANVDQENQQIILSILSRINKEEGTSILFSTHYLSQSRSLADHTVMLDHGMLTKRENENSFSCTLLGQEQGRLLCKLSESQVITLPVDMMEETAQSVRLHIDPNQVIYLREGELILEGTVLDGQVVQVNLEAARVRVGIDCGVRLFFYLSLQEYHEYPPLLGTNIRIGLPNECLIRLDGRQ